MKRACILPRDQFVQRSSKQRSQRLASPERVVVHVHVEDEMDVAIEV
jgi:hypothetical protein